MSLLTGSRPLDDDDLLRYIDHQYDHEGMRLGGVHLRTCEDCAARHEALRQKAAAVRAALELIPGQVPDPNRRAIALAALDRARFRASATGPLGLGWMKVAASVVLLIGLGLSTEPGRAFVAQG